MSWQEVPGNQSVASILAWPASALPLPEMEAGLTALKIRLSDLPCAEWSELADGAPGWACCGLGVGVGAGVRSMPCYIGGGMCVL